MRLPDDVIATLRNLLEETTASVMIEGRSVGSAFFIDSNLLLTCAHVVKDEQSCEIAVVRRDRRQATVTSIDTATDLALLLTVPAPQQAFQPSVAVDVLLPSDLPYMVAGFPKQEDGIAALEIFEVTGHSATREDAVDHLIQIEAGKVITWGMSGGPALSLDSGAVVGIVQSSKDPTDSLGGAAIPLSIAAKTFDVVDRIQKRHPPGARKWRDALGKTKWAALRKPWDMEAAIDLHISGKRTEWSISMSDAEGGPQVITGGDLGEDVAEALFRWAAQRRRIHGKAEVELLGRLLAKGLIPDTVDNYLSQISSADVVHIRLHIDPQNDLADIPWELSAVSTKSGPGSLARSGRHSAKYFSTEDNFLFSRIVDVAPGVPFPRMKEGSANHVLAVLAVPGDWTFSNVYGRKGDKPYLWPSTDAIVANLNQSINVDPFKTNLMTSPQPGAVSDELESGQYDIFHYTGVGKFYDGEPLMAFVDADGQQETWIETSRILALAADNGVRMVVLEFMLPPEGQEFDQLTPSKLAPLIMGDIEAVVLTQQPVHASQCMAFNTNFYAELRHGKSVETAMQRARKLLSLNSPVEDDAGFGWFALLTGTTTPVTILAPAENPGRIPGSGIGLTVGPDPIDRRPAANRGYPTGGRGDGYDSNAGG